LTSKNALYTELLVMRYRRGDASAMEELIRLWERSLYYYVRRLLTNDDVSRQVMQEVWLKVLRGIGRLKEPKSFAAWAYRIAHGTAVDHMRDEYSRQTSPLDEEAGFADDGTDDMATFDNAQEVHIALEQLSLRHREVLTLFFLQDLSIGEIAATLDISTGTVKSRLHYAKKAMKAILTGQDKESTDG
jgi:RNA polymerase sigma-70 factor, ECF subfamily